MIPAAAQDRRGYALLLVAAALAVVLAGQSVSDRFAPPSGAETGRVFGRAGFAYLTGVRTFAAAALWNHLEPQLHEYYEGGTMKGMRFALPTMQLVNWLDPQFEQAYYVAPWIVYRNGKRAEALRIANEGLVNNPRSGWLRGSYANILLSDYRSHPESLKGAVQQADAATSAEAVWRSDADKHDAYQVFRVVYKLAGLTTQEAAVLTELERLDAVLGDALPPSAHDHNGDGKPDH